MLPTNFQPVLRLSRNLRGRDFIIGDLHGAFDLLERAMERVGFDPAVDRLLSPGDLVDRGSRSRHARDWLKYRWFFSARGNHEQMALDAFDEAGELLWEPEHLPTLLRNGMGWWLPLSSAERLEHLRAFARMPLVLEVDTARGPVGVLHADVPEGMDWPTFIQNIEALDPRTLQTCLWGRQRIQADRHEGVRGIGRVFVGHTPQWSGLGRFGNVYAVDTGAVYGQTGAEPGGALTLANVLCATNAMTAVRPLSLLNVADDPTPPSLPFGTGPGYVRMPDPTSWLEAWRNRR